MDKTLEAALSEQGNHEIFASVSYEAMSYWCEANEYSGFAKFFKQQAAEEREHSEKFFRHLLDRGIQPEIHATGAPENAFTSVAEVARLAQSLEKQNSEKIKNCYEISLNVKDYESQPLLMELIEEQVEEEAWAGKMVSLTGRIECPGALYNLDRHVMKEFGD